MDDIKRQDQIQKIESLIKKQNVSRRNFFGSLGKIAVLSQVVALGAFNFLSSCVAMEDKNDASGKLKITCADGNHNCTSDYKCVGNFVCDTNPFICQPTGGNNFTCNPQGDEFACQFFECIGSFTHSG
jgi:secreted PhoX family phosphatase